MGMIPAEAVEAAAKAIYQDRTRMEWESRSDVLKETVRGEARLALEAAAPYMLIHVHHHDIEKRAESFNEGYEACMAQELADDPTTAQDWLDEKLAAAWNEGYTTGNAHNGRRDANPYMLNTEGEK